MSVTATKEVDKTILLISEKRTDGRTAGKREREEDEEEEEEEEKEEEEEEEEEEEGSLVGRRAVLCSTAAGQG
jgi:hypothetical protein